MHKFKIKFIFILSILTSIFFGNVYSAEKTQLLTQDWSFEGITGKFDRASLQRGYQVYTEVCASCHSMRLLSYRNLGEKGGYSDGTQSTEAQMAKDVTTFLSWAAEPTLEQRHKMGVRVLIFLIIFTILIYLSMKKLWSRIDSEK